METLEQLKEIYGEKPEGATHHYFIFAGSHKISNFINANTQQYWDGVLGRWVEWGGCFDDSMRLLSDIKLLIELMEGQKKAYQAYVALEEIKQKYNGENKVAKALLKLAYECDEFALPSDLRKDIKGFLGDL